MTLDQFIAAYRPCQPAVDWCKARGLTDMSVIWQALCRDDQEQTWDWLRWGLRALPLPRRAALLAEMLRRQPVGGGRVLLDLLTDERSRAVLPLLDRWAAGETVPDEDARRIEDAATAAASAARAASAASTAWAASAASTTAASAASAAGAAWSSWDATATCAACARAAIRAAIQWQRDLFARYTPFEVTP